MQKLNRNLSIFFLILASTACTMAPTKTTEIQRRPFQEVMDKTAKPLEVSDRTVILDTRSNFEYGLNRVQGAIYFPWEAMAESTITGELPKDLRQARQRLALAGVSPQTPVIVIGDGSKGHGEAGRLAWTLVYLGVTDVQVADMNALRKNWTQANSPPAKNVASWEQEPKDQLLQSFANFQKLVNDPRGRLAKRIWVIDVRSEQEFFNKSGDTKDKPIPDVGAIHIPWTEFFNENGRPNLAMSKKLTALSIRPDDQILVISQRGVRSSAAAYALIALGFKRVQNVLEGWRHRLN